MGIAIRAKWEPMRVSGFATLGAAFSTLGTELSNPARLLIFQNSTPVAVYISFNGVDDNLMLIEQSYMVIDLSSNKTVPQGFYQSQGDQVYVRLVGGPAISGQVTLSVVYGSE